MSSRTAETFMIEEFDTHDWHGLDSGGQPRGGRGVGRRPVQALGGPGATVSAGPLVGQQFGPPSA